MEINGTVAFDLKLPVANLSGSIKVTGTVYVLLQQAASNLVWSTDGGGTWETRANATLPTATLVTSGETWGYQIPAAAFTGLADMTQLSAVLTDHLTPASITALSPPVALTVRTSNPAVVGDVANLDAAVSSRASQASVDTVDNFVDTEIADIQARLPAALVGGRMDSSVGAMAANVVTAAAVADGAIDAATFAAGAINAAAIATGAVDADALATDAVAEIAAGMTGTGIRTVTLHCQTSGAVAIGTVSIAVYDSNNTQLICTGTADANGDLVVSLDDGAYKVRATKAGYTFALASITVTANATITVTGAAVTISAPSAPGMCVMFGYARDAAGVVHGNATVTAYVLTRAAGRFAGGYFLTDRKKTATTDATTGKFELELQQGAVVNFECKPAGIALTEKTVPALSTQDITTW